MQRSLQITFTLFLTLLLSGFTDNVSFALPESNASIQYAVQSGSFRFGSLVESSDGEIYSQIQNWVEQNQEGWTAVSSLPKQPFQYDVMVISDAFRLYVIRDTVYLSTKERYYSKPIARNEYRFFFDYAQKTQRELLGQ